MTRRWSGTTDLIDGRPGFSALLDRIEGNGVGWSWSRTPSAARWIVTQEVGILALQARGVKVIAANGDDLTETEDEMKIAMRQIAGVFSQLEKARLVKKLKAARDRKRRQASRSRVGRATPMTTPNWWPLPGSCIAIRFEAGAARCARSRQNSPRRACVPERDPLGRRRPAAAEVEGLRR